MYERFRIRVERDEIVVEARTYNGDRRRMRRRAPEASERFEEWGTNGDVRNKGPGAEAVRDYVMAVWETHWRSGRASANLPILGEKHRGGDSTRR